MNEKLKNTVMDFYLQHRNHLPIVIFLLIGIVLIHQGVHSYKRKLGMDQPVTEILISSRDLNKGQTITAQDVEVKKIPLQYVPMGVLKPSDLNKIRDHALTNSISKGEMILWNSLNLHYSYQSASSKIEQGYRAVSIAVDSVSSVSNLIQSGDHVDLITTLELPGETKPSTLTLLQNVTVLSVGDTLYSETQNQSYSTVTLMVLPIEANIINHSGKYGSLSLTLRNPMDAKTIRDIAIVSDHDIVKSAFRNQLQSERDLSKDLEK